MKLRPPAPILHAATALGGVALGLVLTSFVRGGPLHFAPPTPPAGYVANRAAHATVYAPSDSTARLGQHEVGYARARFRGLFGTNAGDLVVVIADSPERLEQLDTDPLRRPGAGLLTFVSRGYLAARAAPADVLALEGGALLREVGGAVRVVGEKHGGERPDVRAGDVITAVNGQRATDLATVAGRLKLIPPGAPVRLEVLRAGRPETVTYIRRGASADTAAEQVYRAVSDRLVTRPKPLSHEACHVFVSSLADRYATAPARPGRAYGHAALPDWFDESAATLCEGPEGRTLRRQHFRANLARRIPLRDFERMRHPLSSAELLRQLGIQREAGKPGVHVIAGEEMKKLIAGTNATIFYSQALSLGEFLAERGGARGFRSLAAALANGRTLGSALPEAHLVAPELPKTVDELESEWLLWVRSGAR